MPLTDDDVRSAALDLAHGMAAFWEDHLGEQLLGVYLVGSLAHGGFNRRYSDIDMALVAREGLTDAMLDGTKAQAMALSPELASKLSLFWADQLFSVGRFPPLDRVDFLDHAVALVERERIRPERPSIDDIQAYLRGTPFESWTRTAARFAALDRLEPDDRKPYLRAHLYPARFVYSWMTGRMASNDDAVAFLDDRRPAGLDVDLVARALKCRRDADDPDSLFPERKTLPHQVAACAQLFAQ